MTTWNLFNISRYGSRYWITNQMNQGMLSEIIFTIFSLNFSSEALFKEYFEVWTISMPQKCNDEYTWVTIRSIVDVKRVSCYHSVGPTTPSTTGLALSGGGGGIKAPPPSLLASRRPTTLPILEESSPVSTPTVTGAPQLQTPPSGGRDR